MGGPYAVRPTGEYLLVVAAATAVVTAHPGRRTVAAGTGTDLPVPTHPPQTSERYLARRLRGRGEFSRQARPAGSVDRDADAVDPGVVGPAVDAATVVADLHPACAGINGGDQVQVDSSGDPGQDDIADLDPGGIDGCHGHQLAAADQRHHRRAARA